MPARAASPRDFEAHALPHRRELFGAAVRMTRNLDEAHDLVQETYLRAYAAWPRFAHGTNVRAWLFRIQANTFINHCRSKKRQRRYVEERPADTLAAFYGDSRAYGPTPEDLLTERAFSDEVSRALDELTPDYRTVVELADLEGVRYRDIAKKLRVPMGTVMSRLFRARRKLEQALASFAAADYGITRAA